jgi:hypothetical protein
MRSCPRTRAYVARRTAEGKTTREIRRCLKRYIARELYRHLTRSMNPPRRALTNIEASAGSGSSLRSAWASSAARIVADAVVALRVATRFLAVRP